MNSIIYGGQLNKSPYIIGKIIEENPKISGKILVVEDEPDILALIQHHLGRERFATEGYESGEKALANMRVRPPDLALLDVMLPGVNGFELTRIMRNEARLKEIPIIVLTARGAETDIVVGLEAGADDYIIKPFSPKVLAARVRAVLRRRSSEPTSEAVVIQFGELIIDPSRHDAVLNGKVCGLTATEFRILHLFARHPGWVFTRSQILDKVRGEDFASTDRTIDVHIAALRRKLGSGAEWIETLRGVGYRFKEA